MIGMSCLKDIQQMMRVAMSPLWVCNQHLASQRPEASVLRKIWVLAITRIYVQRYILGNASFFHRSSRVATSEVP
jgi:hypothetical protein